MQAPGEPGHARPLSRDDVVHPRISVSGISTTSWALDEDLAFYARSGIDQVGVSFLKLERHGLQDGAAKVASSGLRVTNLLARGPFTLADPSGWEAQRQLALAAVDTAVAIDAECLVLTSGPAGQLSWEDAADALADVLSPVAEEADRRGLPLALEHTNSLRPDVGFLHSLRDTVDVARSLGVGVCMEVNACWGERGLATTMSEGVDLLRLVQVSDYVIGTLRTPDRAVPGDGDIPLARIIGQLLEAGYEGVFDIELIGRRIEEEGYEHAVPRAVERVEALLASAGI
ncbi:MAG TPA: sugar phosphate isomerase/epimerase family protein [Acidimicrobiales bacterium]|nr:sugar phosphate isomerase/epimerase family protein [Acidimicrobiales bacterium]